MDISIEKLNANNYSTWKEDVKVVLMEKGSWRIITEEEKVPDKLSGIEGEEERTYQKLLKDYSFRKDRAYSVIYLSSEKEYRLLIAGIEDPVKAWKILEEHFRPDSRARAIGLTDEFFSCRVCPDEDIGIYAARLKRISAQLADCDKPIKDWYHAFQLIRYLPPEYAGIVQAIYRWKDEDFKADKVLSELLAEEARLKQSNKDQEVLACQSKTNSSRPIKVITQKIPSGNHDQVELTSKVKGRQRQNQKRRPRSFSRKRQNTSLVTDANASATTSLPPGTWIFDTAATSHFSCDKDSMLNYRPVKGAEVSVAIGGVTCPVEGTGEVELEFYKNGECETITLLNVLYSPKLKQNLISGSKIDKAGHNFVCNKNILNVYHKDGHKLFYAKRQGGLYYVTPNYHKNVKSKVSNRNLKSNVNISSISVNDLNVWHKRYCHINTKYIVNTSNNKSVNGLPNFKSDYIKCEPCKIAKSKRKTFKPI
ncbi:hypothetical protein AVEN_107216-1, partial [Araneus ventricosus]